MHKIKLNFAADKNHQNQIGNIDYNDERGLGFVHSICILLILHK